MSEDVSDPGLSWWIPKDAAASDAVRTLSEYADSVLTGARLDKSKPASFDWAKLRLPRRVQQAPVILPLHVYGRLKRVCDEGQHCAPLPTGYPKCPCNCGGPFGDCLR